MSIVVTYFTYVERFVGDIVVLISAESCLVNEKIGDLLSMKDGKTRLIKVSFTIIIERELDLVDTIRYAEPGVHDAFHNGYVFLVR